MQIFEKQEVVAGTNEPPEWAHLLTISLTRDNSDIAELGRRDWGATKDSIKSVCGTGKIVSAAGHSAGAVAITQAVIDDPGFLNGAAVAFASPISGLDIMLSKMILNFLVNIL